MRSSSAGVRDADALRRVLVVDDDVDFADGLRDLLEMRGYAVETAPGSRQALKLQEAFDPEVALLDIRLGRTSGVDLAADLKRRRPNLICIMVTAYAEIDSAVGALRAGTDDYLRKPFQPAELFATLERAIAKLRLIGEKEAAEDALRRSHEELEERVRVYKDVPIGLCEFDTNLRYTHINDWLAAINGMSAEEHLGRAIGEVLPDVAQGVESQLRHVIETGEPIIGGTVDAETLAGPGVRRTFQHSYYPIRSGDDTVLGVSCMVEDITERKQAEEALFKSEARLRAIMDHAPMEIYLKDAEGRYAEINRRYEELWGVTNEEIRGKLPFDVHREEHAKVSREHDLAVLESGQVVEREDDAHRHDGLRSLHMIKFPIRDGNGDVAGLGAIALDVTERKQAEAALREAHDELELRVEERTKELMESEARLRAIIDNYPSLITLKDLDGRYLMVNESYAKSRNLSIEDAIGKTAKDFETPSHAATVGEHDREALERGEPVTYEREWFASSGEALPREVTKFPAYDADGQLMGIGTISADITERKRAEEALKASEETSRALLNVTDDSIFLLARDGTVLEANQAGARRFGKTAEEILGMNILELMPREVRKSRQAMLARLDAGEALEFQDWRDGMWFENRVHPVSFADGEVQTFAVFARDITKSKKIGDELARGEERLRQAAQLAGLGHWIWDAIEDVCTYCSEECARIHGVSVETYMACAATLDGEFSFVHPEDREEVRNLFRALRKGKGFAAEYRLVMPNGETRYVQEIARPVFDDGGKVVQEYGTIQDITERKRAEDALRESETHIRAVMENIFDSVVTIDQAGRIESFNPAAEHAFGYAASEAVGQNVSMLMAEPDRSRHDGYIRNYLDTGKGKILGIGPREVTGRRKDGSTFPLELAITEMFSGEKRMFIGVMRDITQRKRAKEELKVSEEMFSKAFQASPGLFAISKPEDGAHYDVNEMWIKVLGHTREEAMAHSALELNVWADPRVRARFVDRLMKERSVRGFEAKFRTKAGEELDFLVSGEYLEVDGEPRLLVVSQDITQRKRAEGALRESETRLRSLLEHSPMPISIKDTEGRYLLVNRQHEVLTGMTFDEYKGKTPYNIFPRAHAEEVDAHLREVVSTKKAILCEVTLQLDDTVRTLLTSKFPILNPAGEVVNVGSIATDITERKRAEVALQLTQFTVDHASDTIFWLDPSGRLVYVNDTACRLLGYAREEFLSMDISEVDPDTSLEDFSRAFDRIKAHGPSTFEARHRAKNGKIVPVEVSIRYVKYGDRELLSSVSRDITERQEMEERLRHAQKMEAVGQLTGGLAHDFNNLLAIVTGNLELLDERLDGDTRRRDLVRRAITAAARGATLTQRLLAFSRMQTLQPRVTDLNELVRETEELLRCTTGESIEVETVLAGGLWPTLVDPGQLENALLNLVVNARDAMPDGGTVTIETANRRLDGAHAADDDGPRPGRYVMLAVSDTGAGMPPEVVKRAFDPFFTTKELGSGLGLSMVYGFVRQSGGHVEIDSEPGRGTTVKAYLPRAGKERIAAAPEPPAAPDPPAAAAPAGAGEAILVVEDDADVRDLAVGLLSGLGFRPVAAADGESALAALGETAEIALLFTDVALPGGMSGVELAREARRRHPGLKVLLTSGYSEDVIVSQGGLDEGVELIGKPYGKASLARKIGAVLNRKGA